MKAERRPGQSSFAEACVWRNAFPLRRAARQRRFSRRVRRSPQFEHGRVCRIPRPRSGKSRSTVPIFYTTKPDWMGMGLQSAPPSRRRWRKPIGKPTYGAVFRFTLSVAERWPKAPPSPPLQPASNGLACERSPNNIRKYNSHYHNASGYPFNRTGRFVSKGGSAKVAPSWADVRGVSAAWEEQPLGSGS